MFSENYPIIPTNPTELKAWTKLVELGELSVDMREEFKKDKNRFKEFSVNGPTGLFVDFSKNLITPEILKMLIQLAYEAQLPKMITAFFAGHPNLNPTEKRAAAHIALRIPKGEPFLVGDKDVSPKVHAVLNRMEAFTNSVRSGEWKGFSGKRVTDVVHMGIGGSDLGPNVVCDALQKEEYSQGGPKIHFVSNADQDQLRSVLKKLDPETTLFIAASKTFTTEETIGNAQTAKKWLQENIQKNHSKVSFEDAVKKHFVAASSNLDETRKFGIADENVFEFWDWVCGRFSLWSSIGLPIALQIGMHNFREVLAGAYEMDMHFKETTEYSKNLPVILALIHIWYINFLNYDTRCSIAYDHFLKLFINHLQQVMMESLGKSKTVDGKPVEWKTCALETGGTGTISQHSFHQLLHAGTIETYIVFLLSMDPAKENGDTARRHCIAQAEALLKGKTYEEACREIYNGEIAKGRSEVEAQKESERLAPQKEMPGNRPSTIIGYDELNPRTVGSLVALLEHEAFVKSVIWRLNCFDQWGVELGKQLAKEFKDESNTEKHSASTQFWLKRTAETSERASSVQAPKMSSNSSSSGT